MAQSDLIQFEDSFIAKDVDNSKFGIVSRVICASMAFETELLIDINTDIFPLKRDQHLEIILTKTLTPAKATYRDGATSTLMDSYDYCMYGKVFKIDEKGNRMTVYASFGGLMMSLSGESRDLDKLELNKRVYILIRKSGDVPM
eukprot:GHVR01022376.1.p1 GENE.GHVR01022376.1~~GHVR01022376.1.p1  ORF type:complete len:144 (+),score=13.64 GHVR01022376.1:294-725(+)